MKSGYLLAVVLAVLATAVLADVQLPKTAAGQRASAMVDAIRGADDANRVQAFFMAHVAPGFREAYPMEAHVDQMRRLQQDLGEAFELVSIDIEGSRRISLGLRPASGSPVYSMALDLEPAPPHLIAGMSVSIAGPAGPTELADPALESASLDVRVSDLARRLDFSGVVAVAKGGAIILQQAHGAADRKRAQPNRPDTRFNLGSINKIFTAAAIHQLAADGKLSLDDTLGRHLPDYPNAEARAKVSLRQLLDHRSGIGGDIFSPRGGGSPGNLKTIAAYLDTFSRSALEFQPGEREEYSNAGYIVLGAVIERVSGRSYFDFVKRELLAPLGMKDTGWDFQDRLKPNTAIGYSDGQPNSSQLPGRGSPAGGGYSSATDMIKFARALQAGQVPGVEGGIGIAGGAPGINAALEAGLPGGYSIVVLANGDPPVAETIAEAIRSWLRP